MVCLLYYRFFVCLLNNEFSQHTQSTGRGVGQDLNAVQSSVVELSTPPLLSFKMTRMKGT